MCDPEEVIGPELFDRVKRLGLESSLRITGIVKKDEKQAGGYEIQADAVEIFTEAEEYRSEKKTMASTYPQPQAFMASFQKTVGYYAHTQPDHLFHP